MCSFLLSSNISDSSWKRSLKDGGADVKHHKQVIYQISMHGQKRFILNKGLGGKDPPQELETNPSPSMYHFWQKGEPFPTSSITDSVSFFFDRLQKMSCRNPFYPQKVSLWKQTSFFAPGPSGVSWEGRLWFTAESHQYGIVVSKSQTFFSRNATRAGSKEGRLFWQANKRFTRISLYSRKSPNHG